MVGSTAGRDILAEAHLHIERVENLSISPLPEESRTLFYLPEPASAFLGRQATLNTIEERFVRRADTIDSGLVALAAAPGIGKTQVAIQYALRHRSDYDLVWWIRGGNKESIDASLAQLVAAAGFDGGTRSSVSVLHAAIDIAERRKRCIFIVDDCDEPELLRELLGSTRADFLVTSKSNRWPAPQTIELRPFDEVEALDAIRHLFPDAQDSPDARDLAHRLGYVPWAIATGARYCHECGIAAPQYARLLAQRPETTPENKTLALILERIEKDAPEANALLSVLATLAPSWFPLDLFNQYRELLPDALAERLLDPVMRNETCATLLRWHLLSRAGEIVSMHSFVQIAALRRLPEGTRTALVKVAANLLSGSLPPVRDRAAAEAWAPALPHAVEVVNRADQLGLKTYALAYLASGVGECLWHYHTALEAARWHLRATDLLGGFDATPSEAIALQLHSTAKALIDAGEVVQAKLILERAIHAHEQLAGRNSLPTAACYRTRASLLLDEGRYEEAAHILKYNLGFLRALSAEEAVEEMLFTHELLAVVEAERGSPNEAIEHLRIVLNAGSRGGWAGALRTAGCLTSMGGLLYAAEHYETAELALRQACKTCERIGAADSVHYASAVHNLAAVRARLEDATNAMKLAFTAVSIRRRHLRPDAPDLAISRGALGVMLTRAGRPRMAAPLLLETCRSYISNFGFQGRRVASAFHNLACLLDEVGMQEGATLCLYSAARAVEKSEGQCEVVAQIYDEIEARASSSGRHSDAAAARQAAQQARASSTPPTSEQMTNPMGGTDKSAAELEDDLEVLWRSGHAAMQAHDWVSAKATLEEIVRRGEPESRPNALLNLALAEARSFDGHAAMEHVAQVRTMLAPDDPRILLAAEAAWLCGDDDMAIELVENVPESLERDQFLLTVEMETERFADALATATRLRAQGDDRSLVGLSAAKARLALGDIDRAAREFDEVIEAEAVRRHGGARESPELIEGLFLKTVTLLKLHNRGNAPEALAKAAANLQTYLASTAPSEHEYARVADAVFSTVDDSDAARFADLLQTSAPDQRVTLLQIRSRLVGGEYDQVIEMAIRHLAPTTDEYVARELAILRCCALLAVERFDEVISVLKGSVAEMPPHIRGNFLGRALAGIGELAQSRNALLEAHRAEPGDPLVLTNLADVEVRLGDFAAATKHADAAIRIAPHNSPAWEHLLAALGGLGRIDDQARVREAAATFGHAFEDAR